MCLIGYEISLHAEIKMKEMIEMTKCNTCGGTTVFISGGIVKCEYCGRLYSTTNGEMNLADSERLYCSAVSMSKSQNEETLKSAIEIFEALGSYKDSSSLANACRGMIAQSRVQVEERRLAAERQAELERIESEKRAFEEKQKAKVRGIIIAAVSAVAVIAVVMGIISNLNKSSSYNQAMELYSKEQYEEAREIFNDLGDYSDAATYVSTIDSILTERGKAYEQGIEYYENALYEEAIESFGMCLGYLESHEYLEKSAEKLYEKAKVAFDNENYEVISSIIEAIPENSNIHTKAVALLEESNNRIIEIENENNYAQAIKAYDSGDYATAQKVFIALGTYNESVYYKNEIGNILYKQAIELFNVGNYISCIKELETVNEDTEWNDYLLAIELEKEAKDSYIKNVETSAMTILKEEGYVAFEDYIDNSVNEIYLDEYAEKIKNKWKPTYLFELDVLKIEKGYDHVFTYENGVEDNIGNVHNHVLKGGNSQSYYLNGQFDVISGVLFILKEKEASNKTIEFVLYDEDWNVIYRLELEDGGLPQEFKVDVSGIEILRIHFCGTTSVAGGSKEYGAIGEVMLYKNP